MTFAAQFLEEAKQIIDQIDTDAIEKMAAILEQTREANGRLFIIGSGGGAGHASHAVNDFRKIAGFEAYTPTDNVSELTARINDDGWEGAFAGWLNGSRLRENDLILVFSVGGGNLEKNISANIVEALKLAKDVGAQVIGVVGRDGGYTAQVADACVIIPTIEAEHTTPQTEAFQAVVWHLLVTHPKVKVTQTKWESTK